MKSKLFIFSFLFFIGYSSCLIAQEEELFDKTWYLYRLEVGDDSLDFPILPTQADFYLGGSTLVFTEDEYDEQIDGKIYNKLEMLGCPGFKMCDAIFTNLDHSSFTFRVNVCLPLADDCEMSLLIYDEYREFSYAYDDFYYNQSWKQNIDYEIVYDNGIYFLELTNGSGDKAYYASTNLSVDDYDEIAYYIAPNPVQNILNLHTDESTATRLQIYDTRARLLLEMSLKEEHSQIDISDYPAGVYFVKLRDQLGKQQVLRFIKE